MRTLFILSYHEFFALDLVKRYASAVPLLILYDSHDIEYCSTGGAIRQHSTSSLKKKKKSLMLDLD